MKNQNQTLESVKSAAKELIKPRVVSDSNPSNLEALCVEYGSGTDCRIVNNSVDPDMDSLLF